MSLAGAVATAIPVHHDLDIQEPSRLAVTLACGFAGFALSFVTMGAVLGLFARRRT